MLRIIIAALLICTVLAGAKLIFQGGEGDISWNVNHIGVLYIRHWVVVPNATPRVEVRGFDQDRVVTAGTLK
ncbi:hypothetical protein, partial [Pyrobaculum sp.]|uniref:hypothetical protein n=1 Tax=Pyrobaculum sp. TaxID=2004705 RepID=UPI003D0ABDB9